MREKIDNDRYRHADSLGRLDQQGSFRKKPRKRRMVVERRLQALVGKDLSTIGRVFPCQDCS
jgi:hypothetical protein